MKRISCFLIILIFVLSFNSCTTNYYVHVFSDNIETLVEKRTKNETTERTEITYEGTFSGDSYEKVMQAAKKAGYTKVLSIEYGTKLFLGFIGTKFVTIRCAK